MGLAREALAVLLLRWKSGIMNMESKVPTRNIKEVLLSLESILDVIEMVTLSCVIKELHWTSFFCNNAWCAMQLALRITICKLLQPLQRTRTVTALIGAKLHPMSCHATAFT